MKVVLVSTSASKLKDHDTGLWIEEMAAPYYLFKGAGYDVVIDCLADVCNLCSGSLLYFLCFLIVWHAFHVLGPHLLKQQKQHSNIH